MEAMKLYLFTYKIAVFDGLNYSDIWIGQTIGDARKRLKQLFLADYPDATYIDAGYYYANGVQFIPDCSNGYRHDGRYFYIEPVLPFFWKTDKNRQKPTKFAKIRQIVMLKYYIILNV